MNIMSLIIAIIITLAIIVSVCFGIYAKFLEIKSRRRDLDIKKKGGDK